MKTKISSLTQVKVFAIVASLALAACAKPDPSAPRDSAKKQNSDLNLANSIEIAQETNTLLAIHARSIVSPNSLVQEVIGRGDQAAHDCVTQLGNSTDSDSDLVPSKSSFEYRKCESAVVSYEGDLGLQDADDENAKSGYRLKLRNLKWRVGKTTLTLNQDFSVLNEAEGVYHADLLQKLASDSTPVSEIQLQVQSKLISDETANPFAAGTLQLSGSLTRSRGSERLNLLVQSSQLHFSTGCKGPDFGSITLLDQGKNQLEVSFAACGESIAKLNGQILAK